MKNTREVEKTTIRIGTRASKLALWQAEHIAQCLKNHGMHAELVLIETKGDKVLNQALSKIGSKGLFTEEIEEQLRKGSIDIAVHSAKDMQATLQDDLELLAFTEREKPNDVVISLDNNLDLKSGQPLVMGTSSVRRGAMLRHYLPHLQITDMRGNLQTRMQKLEDGHCNALLLAYAGVIRMGYQKHIVEHLSLDEFVPAVGQGSIAIEASKSLPPALAKAVADAVDHPATSICLHAERAFLKRLEGGCSIPAFGLAIHHQGEILLTGGIISPDGQKMVKKLRQAPLAKATDLGKLVAEEVLADGGEEILAAIKSAK